MTADLHSTRPAHDGLLFRRQRPSVQGATRAERNRCKPMRYQCRPAGKPATHDFKFPGTYNARRDNLRDDFWKGLFGRTHGILVVRRFYENVPRDGKNAVLEFDPRPRPGQDMLVAWLWSRWTAPGEPELLSFAAITDEPPPEVAGAGHDSCIVPIKAENVDAWLNPDPNNLPAQYAILDDRERASARRLTASRCAPRCGLRFSGL